MTRQTDSREARLPVPAGQLPAFTPVPRERPRRDGWTEQRQRAFIEALADTGSVDAACRAVNMSQPGVYQLRREPGAESFRQAWEAALQLGVQRIEDVAMERALNGVEVPVYSYGKLVGTRRTYNDRLLMFMLRNRAPERFTEGKAKGLGAIGKMERDRLKKQWRKEWEEEQEREASEADHHAADFVERIAEMHVRWWAHLSPRTRAAYREFRRLEALDEGWRTRSDAPEAETAAAEAEYTEVFAGDGRSRAALLGEACAIGDDRTCPELENGEADEPQKEPPPAKTAGPRIRTLGDDTW